MIGVIGGAGVAATNRLATLIEEKMTQNGAFRDCHHPEMIIWQATQVPSRSMYLEGRGESFIPGYVDIGKKLKACGCNVLCMCCNTAHYYIETLQEQIGLPIINLMEEVAKEAKRQNVRKVGMMCSDGLVKVKFYDKIFMKVYPEAEIIYPDSDYQRLVTLGICNAKNIHRWEDTDENPNRIFPRVIEHLKNKDADCVVAGCTDINNSFTPPYNTLSIRYIDSLSILRDSILKYYEKGYNHSE